MRAKLVSWCSQIDPADADEELLGYSMLLSLSLTHTLTYYHTHTHTLSLPLLGVIVSLKLLKLKMASEELVILLNFDI